MKFDRCLGNSAAETPVNFQNDRTNLKLYLPSSEILRDLAIRDPGYSRGCWSEIPLKLKFCKILIAHDLFLVNESFWNFVENTSFMLSYNVQISRRIVF